MSEETVSDPSPTPTVQINPPAPAPPATPELVNEYITGRVEQYAGWYDKKCGPVKQRYLYIKAITVIGGAIVPVLVNVTWPYATLMATFTSLLVVILVSWDSVFQYGKQWKNYRSTEQFLRQETILFKHHVGFYSEFDNDRAFRMYIQRIENAIAQENSVTLDTLTRESHVGKSGSEGG
jgi:hypothetical protein